MTDTSAMALGCPIPTPEEAELGRILAAAQGTMFAKIHEAIMEASSTVSSQFPAVLEADAEPPPAEYYMAVAQQHLFCLLCGADPETLAGGSPEIAQCIVEGPQGLASTWQAAAEDRV